MTTTITPGFDPIAWQRLAVRAPQHDTGWLRVMASRLPGEVFTVTVGDRLGFCAVLVTDPDAYEAYNPYAVLWRDPPVFAPPDEAGRRLALSTMDTGPEHTLPALVLVAPGYLGDPAGAAATDPRAVAGCLDDVLDWCAGRGLAGLHVMYVEEPVVASVVRSMGGCGYPLITRWALPVWWDDWDDYLHRVAAGRRRRTGYELRRLAEAGVTYRVLDPIADAESILNGRCDLLRWYGQRADRVAERRRLRALAEVFGDRLTAYGAEHAGEVVGCSVFLSQGRRATVVYTGTTERGRALAYLHFAVTFYVPTMHLSRRGYDEIDYGIGHDESKRLRDCVPRPLTGHAIGVTPGHQRALRAVAQLLAGPDVELGVAVVGAGA